MFKERDRLSEDNQYVCKKCWMSVRFKQEFVRGKTLCKSCFEGM